MPTRRRFLAVSAAVAAAPAVHAAGGDTLKVALVGCGARGTGAATQALKADRGAKLVALADAFADRLDFCLDTLTKDKSVAPQVDVPPARRFVGFDAYERAIAESDVVLLCTPPHFRPRHLAACVAAGKHVFAEKPVAVDAPGVRAVLAACAEAKKKNLAVVSGLCLRYDAGFRETVGRLRGGAIGDVVTVFATDHRSGRWAKPRQPGWTDVTYQMRNWYNFTWLSGDFNVEQHVHFLDVAAWLMGDTYPVKAVGLGGRAALTGAEYGNVFDHFAVTYEYASGVRLVSACRQQPGTKTDMSCHVFGTKGKAVLSERPGGLRVTTAGGADWVYEEPGNLMYQAEHDELFASIRAGKPLNNGEYMAKSTLLAVMGRMAAYTGQQVTWDMAMNSKEDLTPPGGYDWAAKLPDPPAAVPGVTKFG